jgi:hypothetical protein
MASVLAVGSCVSIVAKPLINLVAAGQKPEVETALPLPAAA